MMNTFDNLRTAHTPGPWAVSGPFPTVVGMKDGRPVVIADAQYRNNEHSGAMVLKNEGMANARLIAAAPALYEALERLLKEIDDPDCESLGSLNIVKEAKATLAAIHQQEK
jgi:hypothetical protein